MHNLRLVERSRMLCDSWHFSVLTTALTFYALFGDDLRLSVTHKRTDTLFDCISIFCLLVFAIDIFASSLGKEGYFLGFFFTLDFVSTVTLVFDLTWISDALSCTEVDSSSDISRNSRAGRESARASRTVRIIRLIRLVKLYKTYRAAMEQKEKKKRKDQTERDSVVSPGNGTDDGKDVHDDSRDEEEEDDEEEDDAEQTVKPDSETRVGKKLSDMTTRRVIVLVLVMLFCMPYFSTDSWNMEEFHSSATLGSSFVYSRWRDYCLSDGGGWCFQLGDSTDTTVTAPGNRAEERYWYEYQFLQYLYHHHAGDFFQTLHWVGFSTNVWTNGASLGILMELNQDRFLSGFTTSTENWDALFASDTWQRTVKPLPDIVKQRLCDSSTWQQCDDFVGLPVVTAEGLDDASQCSIKDDLRCTEVKYFVPLTKALNETDQLQMLFAFDTRGSTKLEAGLSMLQTIFICFLVGIGMMTFTNDANQLLLNPIERMIAKMETIKDNPLEAMKLGDLEYRREQIENARRKEQFAKKGRCWKLFYTASHMRKVREPMETVILEKTIIKLGGLLALGFGEAGAEIIGQNMKGGHSAGVNAMVPGQKVDAIIGFCTIRNFTDATEVLKERVMLFVNRVGEIVHGCVDDYHGSPNKNIGDSFLLVWRLSGVSTDRQTKLADMAMVSFVRIVAAINRSPVLAEYRGHPGLLQRIPGYRVQMGFGLHCGWAIEGAIGSEFKIDASYLSPNVNVAARLENATKQFGVWILLSHFMIMLCSKEMAVLARLIDHVTVKGSKQPVRLYTMDLDCLKLKVQHRSMDRVIKNRFKVRQVREVRKNEKWADEYNVSDTFNTDEDIVEMRATYSTEFFERFAMAYRNYEVGEWCVARDMLLTCHYTPRVVSALCEEEMPEDGPTSTLLSFMRKTNFCPPESWPGHRELTEK